MFFFFDQSQAKFSLANVFKAYGPGSWLEPRLGSIWQDNAGTTPTTTAGQSLGKINDLSGYGNNATQANAANKPTYQLNSGLPYAECGSNGFMTVSLPAINVRRNLLTYTEQFDNAAWVKFGTGLGIAPVVSPNAGLAPDGTATADRVSFNCVGTTASDRSLLRQDITVSYNTTHAGSVYVKAFSAGDVGKQLRFFGDGLVSSTIITLSDIWQRVDATRIATLTAANFGLETRGTFTGNTTADALVWGAQLELGSVATDYQKITDWTSEQFSSSGSVYFALPTGMSALHNQSIGTSYSAPIQSMDLYGAYIFPNRLPTFIETQLQRYCAKLAGI